MFAKDIILVGIDENHLLGKKKSFNPLRKEFYFSHTIIVMFVELHKI